MLKKSITFLCVPYYTRRHVDYYHDGQRGTGRKTLARFNVFYKTHTVIILVDAQFIVLLEFRFVFVRIFRGNRHEKTPFAQIIDYTHVCMCSIPVRRVVSVIRRKRLSNNLKTICTSEKAKKYFFCGLDEKVLLNAVVYKCLTSSKKNN